MGRGPDRDFVILVALAAGVDEGCGRGVSEGAFVALITAGILLDEQRSRCRWNHTHVVAALRAGTLDETISKEESVILAVRLIRSDEFKVVSVVNVFVHFLGDAEWSVLMRTARSKLTQCAPGLRCDPTCRTQSRTTRTPRYGEHETLCTARTA